MSFLWHVFFCVCSLVLKAETIDLEHDIPDWVLETKQIHIPGYFGAFNPSLVYWKDKILFSFRVRNEHLVSTFEIGLVWLDRNFNVMSEPQILKIYENSSTFAQHQDPRLIVYHDKLYILYSNFIKIEGMVTRRMFMAQVHEDHGTFFIKHPLCLHPFPGATERWEKNWVPFIYDEHLLLAYSLLPHKILKPLSSGECVQVSNSWSPIDWPWGELRGGTQAYKEGNEYLSFFHSSKKLASVHSGGKEMMHYFMGAYTFCAQPPFEITRISKEPIIGKNFYEGPAYNTWKPLRAIFPMGFISDEYYIWVVYGRQDHEVWVVKLDKRGLFESLASCSLHKIDAVQSTLNTEILDGVTSFAEHSIENS